MPGTCECSTTPITAAGHLSAVVEVFKVSLSKHLGYAAADNPGEQQHSPPDWKKAHAGCSVMLLYFRSVLMLLDWLLLWLLLRVVMAVEMPLAALDKRMLTELSP
jgi:hypothetical protein